MNWTSESAELITFNEDLTSRKDVHAEGNQDGAPERPLVREFLEDMKHF